MKVWLVSHWVDFDTAVTNVCASEELALAAANKLVEDEELEVTWETSKVFARGGEHEVIFGTLTYQGDECSTGLIIECREVEDV